jgi:hypothetical protein
LLPSLCCWSFSKEHLVDLGLVTALHFGVVPSEVFRHELEVDPRTQAV